MILQDVLCDIKESILNTGYFFKFYEYTSMIEVDGNSKPMYFIDGDNVVDVHDFDVNGSGYVRKTGSVSIRSSNFPQVKACESGVLKDLVFPLRAVFAVPKKKLDDNGFSNDILALELMEVFNRSYSAANISLVKANVLRYETDRGRIWKEEVTSGQIPLLNLSYIYIDFELIFTASIECLKENCY